MKKPWRIPALILTVLFLVSAILIIKDIPDGRHYRFDTDTLRFNGLSIDEGGRVILDPSLYDGAGSVESGRFSLGRGHYEITFSYESESDIPVYISLDNDISRDLTLFATGNEAGCEVDLTRPTDRAKIVFTLPESGRAFITSIDISSGRLIFTDRLFQLGLLAVLYFVLLYIIWKFPGFDREGKIAVIALIAMAVLINAPLYIDSIGGVPYESWHRPIVNFINPSVRFGIDTRAQLLRLEGVVSGIFDRQFPVIIAPNYLNECGELSFLYPDLFLYPFALMRILGASMPIAFRWMSLFVNIATMLAIYFSCREILPDVRGNLVITALYLFEPHRVRVIYEKGASTGMGLPYVFVPLCIAGMYLILRKEKKGILLLAFGVTGVLQSHITSFILLMILLVILGLVFIRELTADKCSGLFMIIKAALLALGMNLGFLVIFLWYYAHGVNTSSLEWNSWYEMLLTPASLATDTESRFYLVAIPAAIILLVATRRRAFIKRKLPIALTAFTAVLFLMTSTIFPWKLLLDHSSLAVAFGNYMQKPHRFYTLMSSCILFAILLVMKETGALGRGDGSVDDGSPADKGPWDNKSAVAVKALLGVMILAALVSTPLKYAEYLDASPLLYDEVMGDMNSRQNYNYLPIGASQDSEFSASASLSDWDAVQSLSYEKKGTKAEYRYITDKEGIYAEFPLLLYDGYEARDENGDRLEITAGDEARVRVALKGDGTEHGIFVKFRVRPIFTVLYSASLLFILCAVVYFIAAFVRSPKKGTA